MTKKKTAVVAVVEPRELANPATGELISGDDPAACALALDAAREMEWKLKTFKRWLTDRLVEERERQGIGTFHLPGVDVVVNTPSEIVWDMTELVKLLDIGLPAERYDKLVTEEITYKVSAAVASQIEKANPEYAKVIERARERRPKSPSATVTPK